MFREHRRGGRQRSVLNSGFWILNFCLSLQIALAAQALAQFQPCAPDPSCIVVAAGGPPGLFSPDDEVSVAVTFRAAQSDGQAGGADEIAAISVSLAISGLELADCSNPDQNGLTTAFTLAPAIAQQFVVFVENTTCGARDGCLCPGAGQQRDGFINLVFSPRSIFEPVPPPKGPSLPNGELLRVRLRVRHDAPSTVRLHVFSEVDDQLEVPKPEFAGFVTAGDRLAVDQTADRDANISLIRLIDGQVLVSGGATPTPTGSATRTASATTSPTPTASATHTETAGPSPTPTDSPTVTPTTDPNATATPTGSATSTPPPTATPTSTSKVIATATATPTATESAMTPTATATVTRTVSPGGGCVGDCDRDGVVRVDELVRAVAISLDEAPFDDCRPADGDGNGVVSVDEVIRAVRSALGQCSL